MMKSTEKEMRTVVQDLILGGTEVSVSRVQSILAEQGLLVALEQIQQRVEEEGGPLPRYRG